MLARGMNIAQIASSYSGVSRALYYANASKARILMYHSIAETPGILPGALNVTPKLFEQQLAYLRKHYHVIPLSTLIAAVRAGKPLPKHSVALTFDDGLANNATIAAPLLEKYGFTGTFYVVGQCLAQKPMWLHRWYALSKDANAPLLSSLAEELHQPIKTVRHGVQVLKYACSRTQREKVLLSVQKKLGRVFAEPPLPYMTYNQVKQLRKHGHEIGYHTETHSPVAGLTQSELQDELVTKKHELEKEIGTMAHFSYPFGEKNSLGSAELLLRSHFASAVTTTEGLVNTGHEVYQLPRLSILNSATAAFAATIEGVNAFALNVYKTISRVRQ
jgi:peptidoglycan/xylan/chitin deacetylase (PgdA/CDA1 family)